MRQWWNKVKWGLARFMQGRYGQDALTTAMLVLAFALVLIASIFSLSWLSTISLVLIILTLLRSFSRNIERRRKENAAWLRFVSPIRNWFGVMRKRWTDRKTHRYYRCPKCGQYLRVPKGKGRIKITCKGCGEKFERKS